MKRDAKFVGDTFSEFIELCIAEIKYVRLSMQNMFTTKIKNSFFIILAVEFSVKLF